VLRKNPGNAKKKTRKTVFKKTYLKSMQNKHQNNTLGLVSAYLTLNKKLELVVFK
jgi:hypothetical protein